MCRESSRTEDILEWKEGRLMQTGREEQEEEEGFMEGES